MKKVLEEVDKGFIAFANIVTALVFIKGYFDKTEDNMLSTILIRLSERIENE